MATQNNSCNICNKRVLSHAYKLQCTYCKNLVHIKCLPSVSKNDSIYTNRDCDYWYCKNCVQTIFPFNHLDDDASFIDAISESWYSDPPPSFDFINNQNKLFAPFDLNENDNLPMHDVDPDLHFYQSTCNNALNACDYHFEDSFNKNISNFNITHQSFSIIHSNIRSSQKKS